MARRNSLMAIPFPVTAALLANIASISAWTSWHPSLRNNRHLHLHTSPLPLSSSAFCPQRRSIIPIPRLREIQRRNRSLATTGRFDVGDGNDIISSVRDSLRYDIVQPHLDELSASPPNNNSNRDTTNNAMPILVLVLAVSGGRDSIGLFHAILALTKSDQRQIKNESIDNKDDMKKSYHDNPPFWLYLGDDAKMDDFKVPCELHVAHFNHEQRGENSDGDEAFVKTLCEENEIPLICYSWSDETFPATRRSESDTDLIDMQESDENSPESFTQDVARKWRRRRLQELLSNLVIYPNNTDSVSSSDTTTRWGAILTAHHRDDADETMLLKLLRGSHLTNLWSMDARSDGFGLQLAANSENKGGLNTPLQSSFVGYFAKPMLKVRKNDITEYLTLNSLKWREDESNSSNKYKRNKIRNELMPLLNEIAGGEHALQKRLSNLEHQSRDISKDLSKRAEDYFQTMPSGSAFLLANDTGAQFDLVREEAMHTWIMQVTNRELQLSYDQMLRIRSQLHDYPERLQWTLDVGSCWKLRRNGEELAVIRGEEDNQEGPTNAAGLPLEEALPWKIIQPESDGENIDSSAEQASSTEELCFASLPESSGNSRLEIKRVKDIGIIKFTPPWRRGRSSIKIKEFLRGQKVPLHRRENTIVLCLSGDSSRHALAVYLEGTGNDDVGRWIVNASFSPPGDLPVTKVVLGKTSLP